MYEKAIWLWRGQTNLAHDITPAIHTRLKSAGVDDYHVANCTNDLVQAARDAQIDMHEGTRLPDLALLAMLQHHGAATPLLDVSLDPLVALYMAVVGTNPDDDQEDGTLFAIRRPEVRVAAYDSRSFGTIYSSLPEDAVVMYAAPEVSERLRVQRGHFLLGQSCSKFRTTMPIRIEDPKVGLANTWVYKFMDQRGDPSPPPNPTHDVAVFRVTAKFKVRLRKWLEDRSGLTPMSVLPTAWHRPHLDAFCRSHGRTAVWE